jgi:hypothetical protein
MDAGMGARRLPRLTKQCSLLTALNPASGILIQPDFETLAQRSARWRLSRRR